MTTIDKIRQEVERLKHENDIWRERINSEEGYSYESDVCCGYEEAINDFKKFLDTFKEEPLELNEAVKEYFQGLWPGMETAEQCNTNMHFTPPAIMRLAEYFYNLGKESKSSIDGLDEVAEEYAHKDKNYTAWLEDEIYFVDDTILIEKAFKAGAEWMLNHNLIIVNDNIKRAEKCLDESTGYDEYPYWDGACDMANAIRREIEGIKTE